MSEQLPVIGLSRLRMEVDGDGVTTLVVSYGCTLRCKYCVNPHCFLEKTLVREYTVEELIETLRVDDLYFRATGGGVMFGGGEPLLQAKYIHEFRELCPKEWRMYMETALNVPVKQLLTVMGDIDTFYVDCKDMNPEIYEKYTGQSNEQFLSNLNILIREAGTEHVVVRVPLIPEYNSVWDCENSERKLRELGVTRIDRLTYNTVIGEEKRRIMDADA